AGAGGSPSGGAPAPGVADERCPARPPTGQCTQDQAGVLCQYHATSGCLCATSPASSFGACTLVDPTCMGAGGASGAPAASGGAGGDGSAKVAPLPRHDCASSSGTWLCNFAM